MKKVANPDPMWYDTVAKFVTDNRMQILADLIHKVETNRLKSVKRRQSRFGMFDATILTAVCSSAEEVAMADAAISASNDTANTDMDHGQEFADLFRERMLKADSADMSIKKKNHTATMEELRTCVDYGKPIFVTAADVDWMLMRSDGTLRTWKARDVFGLIRNGHVPSFDTSVQRISNSYMCFDGVSPIPKYRGFLYRAGSASGRVDAQVIRRVNGSDFEVIGVVPFSGGGCKEQYAHAEPQSETVAEPVAQVVATRETVRESVSVTMSVKERMMAASRARGTGPASHAVVTVETIPADTVASEMSAEDEFNSLVM